MFIKITEVYSVIDPKKKKKKKMRKCGVEVES